MPHNRIQSLLIIFFIGTSLKVSGTEPLDSIYQLFTSTSANTRQTEKMLNMLYEEEYVDSLDLSPDRTLTQQQYAIHLGMAYRFFDQENYQEALEATQKAKVMALEMKDSIALYDDLASLQGSCCVWLGQFDKAIEQFLESIDFGERQHDFSLLSSAYNNMAATYLASSTPENKLYETAHTCIMKAITYEEQVPDAPQLSVRYGMASEINVKRGHLDEAYAMSCKAYTLDSLAGDQLRMARRQSQMGDVLFAMQRMDEAEQQYLESLTLTKALGERHSTAITCKQLANLYVATDKLDKAASYYSDGLAIAEMTGNKYQQHQFADKLYNMYKGHDDVQALNWLERAIALKDSLWNERSNELLHDYQAKYESMEKSAIIEKQEREIHKRNIALGIALFVTIMLIGYFLLLKYYHREKKERKKAEEQVKELETVISERHNTLMTDLTSYILLHMDEKSLSNEEICSHLSISNSNLNQQVNRIKGCSIQGYVQQLRMEKAERLLRTSEKTVSEIAMQCGYEDISYFSRVFKQRYGVAPTKYRQDAKG